MWNFSFASYYEIRHSIVHQRRFCYLKSKTYICLESIKLHVECVGIELHIVSTLLLTVELDISK